MDVVLENLIGAECYVYLNDIIVFSDSAQKHARRLEHALKRFEDANLQLHPSKFVFARQQVQYLGYILSERGISASPDKVKAVREYPTPKSEKDVRALLGLTSFYRRLMPNFAELAKPLTTLTRKNKQFFCCPKQHEAFLSLKERLCTTPVLACPNFKLPFVLTTDASKAAIAGVLSQV
jgi:hypothetical protein